MKVDTKIRHSTKPGVNIFLDLGFPATEAATLHAALRKEVSSLQMHGKKPTNSKLPTHKGIR